MKLTTGILAMAMVVGGSWAAVAAQNTDAIDNARSVAKSLQQKQANDTNAALEAAGVSQPAKPAPGAPAPAVKPATIPGSKPVAVAAPGPKPAATPAQQHNQLQRVNVVQGPDAVRVEIISNHTVEPRVSKLDSPARVLVELPETVMASSQNHISFGSAGVKDVRIGENGKTSPTTSVVVDLDQACTYELTPGSEGKLVLTLHTQAVAKNSAVPVKTPAPAAKPQAVAKAVAPASKPQTVAKASVAAKPQPAAAKAAPAKTVVVAKAAPKPADKQQEAKSNQPTTPAANASVANSGKSAQAATQPKAEDKKWAMNGKRDPFFSPVVQQSTGSGCSTGKKCLEIGNINLRGVVKSDAGFIAVVTNNLNKAYFLRENDPVFNGYVVKITGDSVVFQETVQDKLGKSFTREVVKRIFTPAV
jgi:Tfp pilus assembly protein PilP